MACLPLPGHMYLKAQSLSGTSHLQGQLNHVRLVAPSAEFRWQSRWSEAAQEVFVTGDFTGWAVRTGQLHSRDVHRACKVGWLIASLVSLAARRFAVRGCSNVDRRNCCRCGGTPGPVTSACHAACRCARSAHIDSRSARRFTDWHEELLCGKHAASGSRLP